MNALITLGWIRMNQEENGNGKTIKLTSWQDLDASVTCLFDLYMARLDPFERYKKVVVIYLREA